MNAKGILTMAYQILHVSRSGVLPQQEVSSSSQVWQGRGAGGTWGQVPPSGGTPQPSLMGGIQGGVPPSRGYPLIGGTPSQVWQGYLRWGTIGRGYPSAGGTPGQVQLGVPEVGYPPAKSDGGYPKWGTPSRGYPPIGGTPPARSDRGIWGGVPPAGVTPQQGVPLARSNWGYLRWTWLDLAGVPPLQVWTDKQSETITSRLLRTQSVKT